ncbi:MAG: CDP-diacylglycerol--glycerol-3-phosphate 3-phosphatidyltransferase [Alphaproteobacteria bacterium]|jgi:cardiolipin synthase|nr:CDP-diacylglycerol--glycerol-3-phosphate 3-phosphatidyltransferase [Alphaproteobacteria bacterium]
MLTSLPNLLTLSRILVIPPIVALFWIDGEGARWAALLLYAAACVTDFFDGYAARTMGQISRLGRFLDPVADKILVSSVILLLCAFDRVTGLLILPALVILVREILVSGLREFLAEVKVGMPVSSLAKWKTTIQMFALGFLIIGDASPGWIPSEAIGAIGLWAAALLTLVTGYDYLHAGLQHLTADSPAQGKDATPARVAAEPAKPAE